MNHRFPGVCVSLLACLFICCNNVNEKNINSDSIKTGSYVASNDPATENSQKSNDPIILKHVILEKNVRKD